MRKAIPTSLLFLAMAQGALISDPVAVEKSPQSLTVILSGQRSTNTAGAIDSYDWNFGDGSVASGEVAEHNYAQGGVYLVSLKVTRSGVSVSNTLSVVAPLPPSLGLAHDGYAALAAYVRDAATLNHPDYWQRLSNWIVTNGAPSPGQEVWLKERITDNTWNITGNGGDLNGALLYPDGAPRYPLVGMPGGNDMGFANHFQPDAIKALSNLATYIRNGGNWTGNCAGSALPLRGYFWGTGVTAGTNPSYQDAQFSNYFSGIPHYGLNLTFNEDLNFVRSPAVTHLSFAGLASNVWNCAYRGGISFFPTGAAALDTNFQWLGVFSNAVSNQTGHTLQGKYASWIYTAPANPLTGLIIGNGWHPEISSGAWRWQDAAFNACLSRFRNARPLPKAPLLGGVARSYSNSDEKVGDGQYHFHPFYIPAKTAFFTLTITGAGGDCDLYVGDGYFPTRLSNRSKHEASGAGNRSLTMSNPAATNWLASVRGDHSLSNGSAYVISLSYSVVADTNAPVVTASHPGLTTNHSFVLTLTASEPNGYVSTNGGLSWNLFASATNLALSQSTTVKVYGCDVSANTSATQTLVYGFTNNAPTPGPAVLSFKALPQWQKSRVSLAVDLDFFSSDLTLMFDWRTNGGGWASLPADEIEGENTNGLRVEMFWYPKKSLGAGSVKMRVTPQSSQTTAAVVCEKFMGSALALGYGALEAVTLTQNPVGPDTAAIGLVQVPPGARVELLSPSGQRLIELHGADSRGTMTIEPRALRGSLAPGVYFLRISLGASTRKLALVVRP